VRSPKLRNGAELSRGGLHKHCGLDDWSSDNGCHGRGLRLRGLVNLERVSLGWGLEGGFRLKHFGLWKRAGFLHRDRIQNVGGEGLLDNLHRLVVRLREGING